MSIAEPAGPIYLPWAARAQDDVSPVDHVLATAARRVRPRVLWWWTREHANGRSAARCNICTDTLAEWSGTTRIPRAAMTAIMGHRDTERRALALNPGTDTAGTIPADVAPGQEADR